jgi:hypothetical protein
MTSRKSDNVTGRHLGIEGSKRSRNVRCGALVGAAVVAFLSLSSCDRPPQRFYKYGKADEQQEKKEREAADRMWSSGHYGSGGTTHFSGGSSGVRGSGGAAESRAGTVRGGFGQSGIAHSSGA